MGRKLERPVRNSNLDVKPRPNPAVNKTRLAQQNLPVFKQVAKNLLNYDVEKKQLHDIIDAL